METKKLTAKDLMIGDYMKYKDGTIVRIARVGDVSTMDAPIYCRTQLKGYFSCQLDDIEPIPLTAEILERNFEQHTFDDYSYYEIKNDLLVRNAYDTIFLAQWIDTDTSLYQVPHYILDINYVHELQHILHLLGSNKEIVL